MLQLNKFVSVLTGVSICVASSLPAIAQPLDFPPSLLKQTAPSSDTAVSPAVLSPATPIQISNGSGTGTGTVSMGHQVFSFYAASGDRVTLDVEVTETFSGGPYTDDDSQLFVFDGNGRLIAENDDDGASFQSRLENLLIAENGTYYAVVTTWPNKPVLNDDRTVTNWSNDGSSHIEFVLIVSGVSSPLAP
jgi:hypothetical protein